MALQDKFAQFVDAAFAGGLVKTGDGENVKNDMADGSEDQGEVVDLKRKPDDFDDKREEYQQRVKEDIHQVLKKKSAGEPGEGSGDAAYDYLVSLMTNDTGMGIDKAIEETKNVFFQPDGAPTEVGSVMSTMEADITASKIQEMEESGALFASGPSGYIDRIYDMFLAGKKDLRKVSIIEQDFERGGN